MSNKKIFFVVLILGLLTLTGSAFAEDVLPTKVKESIEPNENLEKDFEYIRKDIAEKESKLDEQKTKIKSENEEEEAIKKARMEWKKAAREEQEAKKNKATKKNLEAENKENEKLKAENKANEKLKAERNKTTTNDPKGFWRNRER